LKRLFIPEYARSADEQLRGALIRCDVNDVQQALKAGANPNRFYGHLSAVEFAIISIPHLKGKIYRKDEDKKWIKEEEEKCIEILKELFSAGARVKQSYLHWPIERNSIRILELLLQKGTDLNTPVGGLTPIELAVKYNSKDVMDFLIKQGVKPVEPHVAAQLSLLDAAENHDIIRMEQSFRDGAKLDGEFKGHRFSALLIAAPVYNYREYEVYGAIAYLLQKGANPNFKGPNGNTVLHNMSMYLTNPESNADKLTAKTIYRKLSLQALVKAGAKIASQNDDGKTPLHIASEWGNLPAAKFLIENGANVNIRDKDVKTPLDYAKSAEMIKLLKSRDVKEE
jgi:ankyrin repeat protein